MTSKETSEVHALEAGKHRSSPIMEKLKHNAALERRGIVPVPLEERTNRKTYRVFTIWFTMSTNLLPIVTGMTSTLSFGLSLRNAALVIFFFTLLCTLPVAYLATLGPKTGMRQMIQARYSFGYYLVCMPVVLNLATLTGFCVIACVIAGQSISAITDGHLTTTVGIVIVAVLGMVICFLGFRVLHWYEQIAWAPALIAIIVATGCGGKYLSNQVEVPLADAPTVLSFAALVAGFLIPWSAVASDYVTYMHPRTPTWKVFTYTYVGIALPTILLMVLGAAIGGAVLNVPSWETGYSSTGAGGVLAAMLEPAAGFGKFLVVVFALAILGNLAGTMYSITLNFQLLVPWLVHVPRFVFAVVITAIVIPVSIAAAGNFFVSLENFIGIIGYWAAAYVGVVMVEHRVIRKRDCESYDHAVWNVRKALPSGVAAVGAAVCSFALVIPCMAQVWFSGPIARHTGDIGFEMALLVTVLVYIPFRLAEIKIMRHM